MDAEFYYRVLYPLQDRVLAAVRDQETRLYLAGGTAASRGYLQHRFSDDLDLFTNDDPRFGLWSERVLAGLATRPDWTVDVLMREERFVRLDLVHARTSLKIEMVNDVPAHVGEIRDDPVLGRVDSAENLLANKLTALVDRGEPKDLADVWGFCTRMGLSIHEALKGAQSKAAGLFPPDVARILMSATEQDWQMVRWISAPVVDAFLRDLRQIGNELLLIESA